EVIWQGHGSLAGDDGWVSLHVAETAHLTLHDGAVPDQQPELAQAVLKSVSGGGAMFFSAIAGATQVQAGDSVWSDAEITTVLWELVWAGLVTGDTLAPLRARLSGGRTTHNRGARRRAPARARYAGRRSGLGMLG